MFPFIWCADPDVPQKKTCHGLENWEGMLLAMIPTLFSMSTLNHIATLYLQMLSRCSTSGYTSSLANARYLGDRVGLLTS